MITGWPVLAPLLEGAGIVKGSRTALEQKEVVKWIKEILFVSITTRMASQQFSLTGVYFKSEGISFHDQFPTCLLGWHRIAVGFKGYLTVAIEMDLAFDAAVKRANRQGAQIRALFLPRLAHALWLPIDDANIIAQASLKEVLVQFLERGNTWYGHKIVSP